MRHQEVKPEIVMPGDVINSFYRDNNGRIYVATDLRRICSFDNGKLLPLNSSLPITGIQQVISFNNHFFFIGPYSGPSGVFDSKWNLVGSWQGPPAFYNSIYKDPVIEYMFVPSRDL